MRSFTNALAALRRLPIPLLAVLGVASLGVVLLLVSVLRGPQRDRGILTLFVSGDTRGYLEPCGCRRDQSGGLPGRQTLVKSRTHGDRILVDIGNMTAGNRPYDLLKLKYLLQGMAEMGYSAANLGRREAALSSDDLTKLTAGSQVPLVSANLTAEKGSTLIGRSFVIVRAAGHRFGIMGVVETPKDELGSGLSLRPAIEALAELLPELDRETDQIIVLAHVPPETLSAIATRFPEIDVLLGGDIAESSSQVERINQTDVFSVTNHGKVLGTLKYRSSGGRLALISSQAHRVADTLSPAADMVRLLDRYREELSTANLAAPTDDDLVTVAEDDSGDRFVGEAACAPCHAGAHRITTESAHAHAFQTLVDKKSEYDPDCLRCHTVGFGSRDGFRSAKNTSTLTGVQCESCHGRGAKHIENMKLGNRNSSTFDAVTPSTCVKCHDVENSENFTYDRYWELIRHGMEKRGR